MKRIPLILTLVLITSAVYYFLIPHGLFKKSIPQKYSTEKKREEAEKTRFHEARMRYEFNMIKDPVTHTIPRGIFEAEFAFAKKLPVRKPDFGTNFPTGIEGGQGTQALNNYIPAGPNNIGGRTRVAAYDLRYNGTSNRVIISGCVSGGIMRSEDGGNTWTRVSPENDIHNLTALAQDPVNNDVWYAGGGEAYGNTTNELGAPYRGDGVWRSTNNGVTWTKLFTSDGNLEDFDHPFDFVYKIAVHPINRDVYIAGITGVYRLVAQTGSAGRVFIASEDATTNNTQMDIAISKTGNILLTVNGGCPDLSKRGVWVSTTGNTDSWTRIAGGETLGVDSVTGWRANSYTIIQEPSGSDPAFYATRRILAAFAPSDESIAYVFYENGLSSDEPEAKPEGDLFKLKISGSTYTWENRSANMPDFRLTNLSNSDPISLQGGYNMVVAVKPDNPNVVFVGGTNLYRSNDGFATANNTAWINGYRPNFSYDQYINGHADQHVLAFNPSNPNQALCGDDGGIRETDNVTAASVSWRQLPNYQTLQYYNVAIDPTPGRNNFAGGAQDNGVQFRDKTGVFGTAAADSNNHVSLFSADGAFVGISSENSGTQYLYESLQFGTLRRVQLNESRNTSDEIRPAGLTTSEDGNEDEFGEFVTNLRLVADNTNDLYYVNFNRLFRTTSASTVTTNSGWTELKGVSSAVNPDNATDGRNISIRGLTSSRGPYLASQALYIGTTQDNNGSNQQGKIFRLDDPRNATATSVPKDITPIGLTGSVQDIAVNPNNDAEIIAVVSNYNATSIWWTKNAKGETPTWRNAEGNLTLPSARSCAIVVKKDAANNPVTEYYVGTSVGLYSTANLDAIFTAGGTPTWQREGGNVLNFAVVQSLAYRPVDNVLLVGTHGNGMYYSFIGTPNYTPNGGPGTDTVINVGNFIKSVNPTLTRSTVLYQVGNMTQINKITVQVISSSGQIILSKETAYQSGSVNAGILPAGMYILAITSEDKKYRHIQKFMKQ